MLNTAAQVSVGSRNLVSETGPGAMNSSDEDSPEEEHGECFTGVYTHGLKAPVTLSQSEVARQKAASEAYKQVGYGKWINSDATASTSSDCSSAATSDVSSSDAHQTVLWPSRFDPPSGGSPSGDASRRGTLVNSDNEDQEEMTEDQKRCQLPRSSTPVESVPQKVQPPRRVTPVAPSGISVPVDPPSPRRGKGKAAARSKVAAAPEPQVPAKGAGKKASTRTADQEATNPMVTRQKASGAGGLRGVGGSGKKDTCGANGTPSKS
jgi:hypothetical protein